MKTNQTTHAPNLAPHTSPSSEANPIVLLVDDMPVNLHLLVQKLTEEHYRVLVAESGASALERVRYAPPDIILLDVMMPGLNGFETCQQLKKNPATRDIPVLFLTALDDTVDKVQGFAVGGADYITKPLQVAEVMARLDTHLALRRLQQKLQRHNEQLEEQVQERTLQLQGELERRKQQACEKHKLLDVLGKQSEQLRDLTTWFVKNKQEQQSDFTNTLMQQVDQSLEWAANHLTIFDALMGNVPNPTDRHQLSEQLEQLRTTLDQLKTNLQITSTEMQQPTAAQQQALENPLLKLSAREREVLQLVVDGKSNTEVAELLYLSTGTVRTHRSRILQKLALDDTAALIKFAIRHQLTSA